MREMRTFFCHSGVWDSQDVVEPVNPSSFRSFRVTPRLERASIFAVAGCGFRDTRLDCSSGARQQTEPFVVEKVMSTNDASTEFIAMLTDHQVDLQAFILSSL